jgi:hypothetical protein
MMKMILPSKSYPSVMKQINLAHLVIFSISLAVYILTPNPYTFGQIDNTTGIVMSNNSTNPIVLSNGTGIMHNTTGIIDDALDALRDSFRSFFGIN